MHARDPDPAPAATADLTAPGVPLERLAGRWEPGVWVGAARRVFGPVSEVVGDSRGSVIVENHPPHHLIALWRPKRDYEPFLRRWPSIVNLVGTDEKSLLGEMFKLIPSGARLWMSRGDIDWALMAEIVMVSERGLAPYQTRELEGFVRVDRARTLAAIARGYTGDENRYRSFVDTVGEDQDQDQDQDERPDPQDR